MYLTGSIVLLLTDVTSTFLPFKKKQVLPPSVYVALIQSGTVYHFSTYTLYWHATIVNIWIAYIMSTSILSLISGTILLLNKKQKMERLWNIDILQKYILIIRLFIQLQLMGNWFTALQLLFH